VVHAGYELGSGFGFGVAAGYLLMRQTTTGRTASIQIMDPSPDNTGTADDALVLGGLLAGGWAGLSRGDRYRLLLRLGAGALFGALSDARDGKFTSNGGVGYQLDRTTARDSANFFAVMPEARFGLHLSDHIDLLFGLAAVVLVRLGKPVWTNPPEGIFGRIPGTKQGYFARFPSDPPDTLAGEAIVVVAPGLGVRYVF
jgi:hypothetical protein